MRIAKYLLLIVPALLALYVIAPYGDRCSGLAHALAWVVLAGVCAVIFLIQVVIDLIYFFADKRRFDLVPLIITCIAGLVCIQFSTSENTKPWTEKIFEGRAEDGLTRDAVLVLYSNNSFDAFTAYADWSCTYVGTYEWQLDTLRLLRSDLTIVTDSAFTTAYRLSPTDSALVPIENGFKPILRMTSSS